MDVRPRPAGSHVRAARSSSGPVVRKPHSRSDLGGVSGKGRVVIVEIECLASPAGTPDEPYRYIEAAIGVIQRSGLNYEVDALGTTVEGEPDELWPLVRAVHEACLAAGAASVVSVVKVAQSAERDTTMDSLTSKFRR